MEYEYWNEEKREWIGLVKMHYHSIKDGRVYMYCNWYAVREVVPISEQEPKECDATTINQGIKANKTIS